MNQRHFAIFSFSALLSLVILSPSAHADQSYADMHGYAQTKRLPKVEWNRSRVKINIINMNPEITNNLEPETSQNILIPIPSIPAPQQQTIIVPPAQVAGNPGTAGSGTPGSVPPGYMMINTSKPPRAKFETNIPPGGMATKAPSLPNGTTTNRLARLGVSGKMSPPQAAFRPIANRMPTSVAGANPAPTETFTYENNGASGFASGSRKEKLSVSGKIDRGSLLNATK
ncbi:MAG: hypothetical protein K2Z81_20395 [Cyanobacteria bacterium]|nr:hypothetical protein [Cyanobacteriota bacterium]